MAVGYQPSAKRFPMKARLLADRDASRVWAYGTMLTADR